MSREDIVLKFDAAEIAQAARIMRDCAEKMYTMQDDLKKAYAELLRSDWRGKGAEKLNEIIGNDWSYKVARYCDLMKQLTTIMDSASKTYDELKADAEKLRLKV